MQHKDTYATVAAETRSSAKVKGQVCVPLHKDHQAMDGWLRSRLIIASQSPSHVLWLPLIIATTIKFQVTCFECSLGYVQFSNKEKVTINC